MSDDTDAIAAQLAAHAMRMACEAAGYTREQVLALPRWQQEWLASGYQIHIERHGIGDETHWLFDVRQGRRVAGLHIGPLTTVLEGDDYVTRVPMVPVTPPPT